jgi:ribonuclease HI
MCNCASPSVRCNCPSYTSAVYSHSFISTVCSFTQYNLHIRSLANTVNGPPASALRKAVTTCIMPCLLYGAEAWLEGRTKNPLTNRSDQPPAVSTRIGWHLKALNQTLTIAARAILPAWKTYPGWALFRDAGLPSALIALEEAKLRFALHLQTVDKNHPLTARIKIPVLQRGRGAGGLQKPHSKVQRLGMILPTTPRHTLMAPHYSPGCRTDPTNGIAKAEAANSFTKWWDTLTYQDVTIFSDESEQHTDDERFVTYGYAIYQAQTQIAIGRGSLNSQSHVFDAKVVGAWRGLQHAIRLAPHGHRRLWMCIDSTSVIWGIRSNAPTSSQWAFLECQTAMAVFNIQARWSPGHTGIIRNEAADRLADAEAKAPSQPYGMAAEPTASGVHSIAKSLLIAARQCWWDQTQTQISAWYRQWELPYQTTKTPIELTLPRLILAQLLAIWSRHGDFAWYHTKFRHNTAELNCSCGRLNT